jgi:hypothetical protein
MIGVVSAVDEQGVRTAVASCDRGLASSEEALKMRNHLFGLLFRDQMTAWERLALQRRLRL